MYRNLIFILIIPLVIGCASIVPDGSQKPDATKFDLLHVCLGANNAGVIKHQHQYYVIVTPEHLRRDFDIIGIPGIKTGGRQWMEYLYEGDLKRAHILVLLRYQWGYVGLEGARSVCRRAAVNSNINNARGD